MMWASITRAFLVTGLACTLASGSAYATLAGPSETIILANPTAAGGDDFFHTSSAAEYGAAAAINIASGPTLTATGTSQGTFNIASAYLTYSFTFTAPVDVTSALIDLIYSYDFLGVAGGPANPGDNATGGYIKIAGQYALDPSPTYGEVSGTNDVFTMSLAPGTSNTITLSVTAYGAGSYAFLDPTISIDPTYLANNGYNASQFAITESAGVANGVTAVPEPSALALLGGGLAGLGLIQLGVGYRRAARGGSDNRAMASPVG